MQHSTDCLDATGVHAMKDMPRPSAGGFRNSFTSIASAKFPIKYPTNRKPALSRRALLQQGGPTKSNMDQGGNGVCCALRGDASEERLLDLVIAFSGVRQSPLYA
jgi:hypothetical protein